MISEREIYDDYMDAYCQFVEYDGMFHRQARKEAIDFVRNQLEYNGFDKSKAASMILKAIRNYS